MNEVLVIFALAAVGCLMRLSMDLAFQFLARRTLSGRTATEPADAQASGAHSKADPVVTFAATLTCYGVLSFVLISKLPGALAFERTLLVFALFCVGGLICEIARARSTAAAGDTEAESDEWDCADHSPSSIGLSVALMLALNLAVAVLAGGQGLIRIVPPPAHTADEAAPELEQIVVIARRASDDGSTFL